MENTSQIRAQLRPSSCLCLYPQQSPAVLHEPLPLPTLRQCMEQRWSWLEIMDGLQHICRLLDWVHEAGFVHRALTPEAILLGEHGEVIISHWEHSAPIAESAPPMRSYCAPEVARRSLKDIDARSDLFSIGAILYEWLTGRPAFSGSNALELLRAILSNQPREIASLRPDCPAPLAALCAELMQTERNARVPSAKVLLARLEELKRWLPSEQDTVAPAEPLTLPSAPKDSAQHAGKTSEPLQTPIPRTNSPKNAMLNPALPALTEEPYLRLGEIGKGGLGRVTKAQDTRLGRVVAVKELLRNHGVARARFLREALITAKLQHPGIVPIYEAGFWPSGEPFYAMKLIAGRAFDKLIKDATSLEERLKLLPNVLAASEAIAYAHHHQILHRDLKPHNIIVGEFGETIVIDWGLAKEISAEDLPGEAAPYREEEAEGLTKTGEILGTPAYMPLEQAKGAKVDERADVYSLGGILYHTLTGRPPYTGKKSLQVIQRLIEQPPTPIEQIEPSTPKALVAIVQKAMSRDASRRYPSAKEFVDDLKRYLSGQLVGAHRYSLWEQLRLKIQQNKTAFVVGLAAFAALSVVGLLSVWEIWQANQEATRQRNRAIESALEANIQRESADLQRDAARKKSLEDKLASAEALLEKDPRAAMQHLQEIARHYPEFTQWDKARTLASDALYRWVPRLLPFGDTPVGDPRQQTFSHGAKWVSYSPDNEHIAAGSFDGEVKLWRADGTFIRSLNEHKTRTRFGVFSPDGSLLATAGDDGELRVWEVASGARRFFFNKHQKKFEGVAFSVDGKRLFTASTDQPLWSWDLNTGEGQRIGEESGPLYSIALSPDGRWLSYAHEDGAIRLLSMEGREQMKIAQQTPGALVAFSPDSRVLASSDLSGGLSLWSVERRALLRVLTPGVGAPSSFLMFSPDGRFLFQDRASSQGELWPLTDCTSTCEPLLLPKKGNILAAQFSQSGRWLALATSRGTIYLRDLITHQEFTLLGHQQEVWGLHFSSDEANLLSSGHDGAVYRWHLDELTPKSAPLPLSHEQAPVAMGVSPGGEWLVVGSADGQLSIQNTKQRTQRIARWHSANINQIIFRDAVTFLVVDSAGQLALWSVEQETPQQTLSTKAGPVLDAVFSGSDEVIAISAAPLIHRWDLQTGGHQQTKMPYALRSLTLLPGESALAVLDDIKALHILDIKSLTETAVAALPQAKTGFLLRASPDGRWLAASNSGAGIVLCEAQPRLSCGRSLRGHHGLIVSLEFSSNGRYMLSGDLDGMLRVWETSSWTSRPVFSDGGTYASFIGDGSYLTFVDSSRAAHTIPNNLPEGSQIQQWLQKFKL